MLADKLFDIDTDVEVIYEAKGLRFWEGGCTLIDDNRIILQLQPAFKTKKTYLGYQRDEIIAHELVHIARSDLNELIFEEILAYQTSPSRFRRYFGPIFRTSRESLIFMLVLFVSSLISLWEPLALLSILGIITWAVVRLILTQRTFAKARKKIAVDVGMDKALEVMVRLTDQEIIKYSKN